MPEAYIPKIKEVEFDSTMKGQSVNYTYRISEDATWGEHLYHFTMFLRAQGYSPEALEDLYEVPDYAG